ncbi:hypothetical protein SLEP1_g20039 [Rubroshorea leprosula]|uniref:Ubiquitin-like domain-containing protein n=2 Tax=Rubroshorea leprosula TaxID=152421 RepID=A0AAV5JAK9_9ROSI|nr:hypothetical protein SLEP1_g20039 [Rubroshorea leprosula]
MSEKGGESGGDIEITVKFGGRSIKVSVSADCTVKDLKSILQPLTDVLPRGQKLIYKGKLLVDDMTLKKSEVTNGAKLMLVASQGLHQGGGPILKDAPTRPISRTENDYKKTGKAVEVVVDKNRSERWKATGVIALSECNLKDIPDEVWACGSSARLLDISKNTIQDVPTKIGCLTSIQKLYIDANGLLDESIQWEGLTSLKHLTLLSINHNCLTTLPSALGALTSLRQLLIANNKLTSLPIEIGFLTQLEVLRANNNRIRSIPACIGDCGSLIEVDLSSNLLSELPETTGNLHHLKALYLSNNGLKSLPSTLFKKCPQLSTLDLHCTEITMDVLRQFEGWEAFDERRRSKHQKQLDFRVASSAEFDEGADKN